MMLLERSATPLIIQTRQGNAIPHEVGYELTQTHAANLTQALHRKFPDAQLVNMRRSPTGRYNCHGMTFFCRRGRIIDDSAVELVLRDDEFHQVPVNNVLVGDIVLYLRGNAIDHSGIVTQVNSGLPVVPWILSKWGDAGEYLHRYNYCPYFGHGWNVKFMREG